jgi:ER membrane protein complex subunit 10
VCVVFSIRPVLKTPPPLNAEGKVIQPAQEKSFLQKYWVYIAVAIAALGAFHVCFLFEL